MITPKKKTDDKSCIINRLCFILNNNIGIITSAIDKITAVAVKESSSGNIKGKL